MIDIPPYGLPFVTRDMLSFKDGAKYELEVNTNGTIGLQITISGFTREGPFSFNFTPQGNGTNEQTVLPLSDLPISITVHAGDSRMSGNDQYVYVFLRINQVRIQKLMAGYLTFQNALTWPYVNSTSELRDRGVKGKRLVTQPSAGADFSKAVGANEFWYFLGARLRLAASSAVANRRVHLVISDLGTQNAIDAYSTIDQTASQTIDYYFYPYGTVPLAADANVICVPIPPNISLLPTDVVKSVVNGLQAADQLSLIRLYAEIYNVDQ